MLIEQTTTYAYKLKYLENPSFDKVRNLAKKFIDELPKELVDDLYNSINRGVDILKTEPEMLVYLYSFGNMHQAKLNKAFENIPEILFDQPEINIIDYGCGQAIGTMCYVDFLKSKNYNLQIKSVTLIEPSKKCLRRAALHTSIFLPDSEITTVNKTFDELAEEDINCNEDVPTLHILSNVLDLEFNISKFTKLVKGRLKGYNQFVCVGPYFGYDKKDFRMEDFAELVGGDISFSKAFGKGQFVEGKNWTCQVVVASVGELEEDLSTEVSLEEIENGVEDEFGVVYSKNGKKLLRCDNENLETYFIKQGTKVICDFAFSCWCYEYDDKGVYKSLKQIRIPNTVTEIGESAFGFCSLLQELTIPNSILTIKKYAFTHCSSLRQFVIPHSVNFIPEFAFNFCTSLQDISIPNSVTVIGEGAFNFCTSLHNLHIFDNPNFIIENDMLIDVRNKELLRYFGKEKCCVIPLSVSTIGSYSLSGCEALQQVIIPDSVSIIGKNAFLSCKSLQNVFIPDSVVDLGAGAFQNCVSLLKIVIPHTITSIESATFEGCSSLEQITFSDTIVSIAHWTFDGCSSLKKIIIPDDSFVRFKQVLPSDLWDKLEEDLSSVISEKDVENGIVDDYGVVYSLDGRKLLKCNNRDLEYYTIKDGTKVICDNAFTYCSLLHIIIPNTVKVIGNKCFDSCKRLTQLIIPDSVVCIGKWAFSMCYALRSIIISKSITVIREDTFLYCSTLQSVSIPNNVTSIDDSAFRHCKSLCMIDIPDSVTKIGAESFCGCTSLEIVIIPNSITEIAETAFYSCTSLKQVIVNKDMIQSLKKIIPKYLRSRLCFISRVSRSESNAEIPSEYELMFG